MSTDGPVPPSPNLDHNRLVPAIGNAEPVIAADAAMNRTRNMQLPLRSRPWMIVTMVTLVVFVDILIYSGVIPILPYIVQEQLQLGTQYTGYLVGAYAAGLLITTPVFGLISDRRQDRKGPIVISLAALGVASLLFLFCTKYWHYLVVRFIQGVAGAGNWTVGLALVSDVFPANQLGATMGIVMSGMSAGNLLGPSLGGTLFDHLGQKTPYYLFAIVSALVLALRLFVDERPAMAAKRQQRRRDQAAASAGASVADSDDVEKTEESTAAGECDTIVAEDEVIPPLLVLLREPAIWVNCLAVVVMSSILTGFEPVLPPYLTETFGTTVAENGYLFLAIGVPNIIVGPIVGYFCDRYSKHLIMIVGLVLAAICVPLITLPTTMGACIAVLIAFGCVFAVPLTPPLPDMGSVVAHKYPAASGMVYGLFNVAFGLSMFIGPIISSQLYSVGGLILPMVIFSGFAVAIMILYVWYYWRHCRTPPADAVTAVSQSDVVEQTTTAVPAAERTPSSSSSDDLVAVGARSTARRGGS
ncbi:hypothetical protein AMAG_05160 [Allomyces macrogynus ATCC 38327]|uniref:Major facilitator superfamily (MFS) profile domain-containing protein n=1 Tax=Allomyces macrogynus (strain ATCC 38327) TaxID=578462 RepID=A0A0L0SB85_ALLM3|nr:hypothetical protein AMAG_05160 [Allomyces macrogynus ATCC 38327]|eukprot:KNE59697.1 hypothetical protein AMAG_05160 [Allomyces macrogynus ATCC 38327]